MTSRNRSENTFVKNSDFPVVSQPSMSIRSNVGEPPWQQQKQERRRLLRDVKPKFASVTGTKAMTSHKIKCAEDVKSIYVREIDSDIEEKDIKTFITDNNIRVLQIRQILGKYGLKKSFKITVPEKSFAEVMNGDFWPVGIEVREWLTNEQLKALYDEQE